MIKFSIIKNGKNILGLGLSKKNIELMTKGCPMSVNAAEMHVDNLDEIIIFIGDTEESMLEEMRANIGPETEIRLQEGKPHDG